MELVQQNILPLDSKFQNNEIKIDASVTDEVGQYCKSSPNCSRYKGCYQRLRMQ